MLDEYRLLAINPGSTSTKIAIFEGERLIIDEKISHSVGDLAQFNSVMEQYDLRKDMILSTLDKQGINFNKLDAIVGRGGLLKPITGGTYQVNEIMIKHLMDGYQGEHASNLGGIIAKEIAKQFNIPAYIVDPVVVDELWDLARISGFQPIARKSIFHALNHKAVARRAAEELDDSYENLSIIIAHLGGGISVGAHFKGQVVDVNNALDGEGPFSPERSGGLPNGDLVQYIEHHDLTWEELKRQLIGDGGLVSYLGTNDAREVQKKIEAGDDNAEKVYQAMAYQISKEIGALGAVLKGDVDRIVLTGGLAYNDKLIESIEKRVDFIADIMVYPGEDEMRALSDGALRVLRGIEEVKEYK